jgi:putative heme transporter
VADDQRSVHDGPGPIPYWLDRTSAVSWRLLVIVGAGAAVLYALSAVRVVVVPLIIGLFLAAIAQPLYLVLRRIKFPPALASAVCLLAALGLLGFLVVLTIGALVDPWSKISQQILSGIDVLASELEDRFDLQLADMLERIRSAIGSTISFLANGAIGAVTLVVSLVSTFVLSLVVLFFYLKDGPMMWKAVSGVTGHHQPMVDRVGRAAWGKLQAFARGTALVALVDSMGIALGALLLGVPSVAAIGVLTFVLGFIPFFGATFAGIVAVLIALADGGLGRGIAMAAIVLAVQQLESNLLQPVLVGRAVKLHPLVVGLGVVAGGAVAGLLGMFFAIPVIASVKAAAIEVRAMRAEAAASVPAPASTDESVSEPSG